MSDTGSLFVEAAARLHFGVLDLRGALGRRFGGLGATVPAPSLLLEASPDGRLVVAGLETDRVREFARRYLAHHRIEAGARLILHRAIPAHSGLGSGTQLGLAVARALAEIHRRPTQPAELARAVARGQRSAIGTWAFALGGFIVEGGRRDGAEGGVAPLLARFEIPERWRCVVAVPPGAPGLSGEAESAAFERLPAASERSVERVAHLVLMQLLPALVEDDLPSFGAALTEVQRITGAWFAPAQGGTFARGESAALVAHMSEWGAAGVGQSSWGPAVYGLVESDHASRELAERVRAHLGERGDVFDGGFANVGARLWRAPSVPRTD